MASTPSLQSQAPSVAAYIQQNPGVLQFGDNGQITASGPYGDLIQRLLGAGYLGTATDASGNPTLTDTSGLTQQMIQQSQGLKPGQAIADTVNPTGAVMGALGPGFDYMHNIVAAGANPTSWVGQAKPIGTPNASGFQTMDVSQFHPGSLQMPDKFGELMYSVLPSLLMAPAAAAVAPMMDLGDFGSLGKFAFNALGNEVMGGKFNPISLIAPGVGAAGLPPWLAPIISSLAGGRGLSPQTMFQIMTSLAKNAGQGAGANG